MSRREKDGPRCQVLGCHQGFGQERARSEDPATGEAEGWRVEMGLNDRLFEIRERDRDPMGHLKHGSCHLMLQCESRVASALPD